ncbi:TadE family protein [Desulfohalovibrio reitneri]|uniref:TadE family protein n=1 Tax=Desulfohalovibrio reitneri TaxID=1307759 RepID=UPI0004A77AF7|nr:TadE family protein [Desulfohalovibrio reitneri]
MRLGKERGSSIIEFALIFPLFLMLALGVVETGNMFRAWLTLTKSAQAAARFAATGQGVEEGDRLQRIRLKAREWESALPGSSPSMDVAICSWPGWQTDGDCIEDNAGEPCQAVEIRTGMSYSPVTPLVGDLLPAQIQLEASDRKVNEPWRRCD